MMNFMNKIEGLEYAKEHGLLDEPVEFYKLFKNIARIKDLSGNEKIVLSVILSYTSRGMEFTMSNKTLAFETGMGEATIARILLNLKGEGDFKDKWIKTYKVYNKITHNIIGRVIVPNKIFIKTQVAKSYGDYEYVEY